MADGLHTYSIAPGQTDEPAVAVDRGLVGLDSRGESGPHVEEEKRRLAKQANRIYRAVCDELALEECFFHGFRAWSEFVDGKMSENKFYESARTEARDILSKRNH